MAITKTKCLATKKIGGKMLNIPKNKILQSGEWVDKLHCADCGCTDNTVKHRDSAETENGKLQIGYCLCDDCFGKTVSNFDKFYAN